MDGENVKILETPIKMDDLGGFSPLFLDTPRWKLKKIDDWKTSFSFSSSLFSLVLGSVHPEN